MSRRIDSHEFYEVDKSGKEISFLFDGSVVWAREGDTISSALVASGRKIVSRSFKYHRPRGIYDADGYGPESLVTVDDEPNLLADRVLARNGMDVRSQNNWPSLDFDLAEINDVFVPFLPNGFYYKMFHKPKWLWPIAEKQIRKVAGLGSIDTAGRHNSRRYELSLIHIQNLEDTLFTVSPGFRNLPFPNSRVCPSMKGSGNLQRSFRTIQTWKS